MKQSFLYAAQSLGFFKAIHARFTKNHSDAVHPEDTQIRIPLEYNCATKRGVGEL